MNWNKFKEFCEKYNVHIDGVPYNIKQCFDGDDIREDIKCIEFETATRSIDVFDYRTYMAFKKHIEKSEIINNVELNCNGFLFSFKTNPETVKLN